MAHKRMSKNPGHHPEQPPPPTPSSRRAVRPPAPGRFFRAWGLHLVLVIASFIFVLPFVWMLCTSLKPLSQVGVGSWLPRPRSILKSEDVTDPQQFMRTLTADSPLARHLRGDFPEPLRATLQQWQASEAQADGPAVDATLLGNSRDQLSRLIQRDELIYDEQAFADVELSTEPARVLEAVQSDQQSLSIYETHRLNRLLIEDAFAGSIGSAPAVQWWNYVDVFRQIPFARYYWNSLFIAAAITFLKVFTSSLAAFAFARFDWPGRDKVFLLYLATMMLPGLVMMIPNYQIMIYLGLVDTMLGLILPAAFTAFGTFLLRQFMLSIPTSLDEAAQIDGASKWRIYWDIILPLARPGMITLSIFVFIQSYHSFFWPLVMLKSQHKYTLPIGLLYFESSRGQETNLLMAAVAMSVVPLIVVFVIMQKYLVRGIQIGAVKG